MSNPFQSHLVLDVNTGNFVEAAVFYDPQTGQLVAPPGYSFVPTTADYNAPRMKWGEFTFNPLMPDSAEKIIKQPNRPQRRGAFGTKQKIITKVHQKLLNTFTERELYVEERHEGSGNTLRVTVKKAELLKKLYDTTINMADEIDLVELSMHILERNQKNKKRKSGITLYIQTTCKEDVRLAVNMYTADGFKATEVGNDPKHTKIVSPLKLKNSKEESSLILLCKTDEDAKNARVKPVSPAKLRHSQKMSVELDGGHSVTLNFQKGINRTKIDKRSAERLKATVAKANDDQSISLSKSTSVTLELRRLQALRVCIPQGLLKWRGVSILPSLPSWRTEKAAESQTLVPAHAASDFEKWVLSN